ncbi:hypothetical protein L1987_67678 [Smallanthus sonchifolius]|uniref:Uncharacterized protein n=1 Tax=Smallanthus sonchifolius TaxID=185202 RepID=A0ACB9B2L1_9ASTR|nr:hypothetical protein L1987_67678 [Smallanthus sonchifolius]
MGKRESIPFLDPKRTIFGAENTKSSEAMKCFPFSYRGEKNDTPKNPTKSISVTSLFTGRSWTGMNSQTVSDVSTESTRTANVPSFSQSSSNLKVFTFAELKSATNGFSRSSKIDHLSARTDEPLSWTMRLKVAQDAARGLTYLHEEMKFQIIFRDFKSSNILLDDQWNSKLSDFGLARLGPQEGLTHVSTAVIGTMGYAAPEYIQTGRLRSQGDVWSYGVFLYELITGRRPLDRNLPKNERTLLEWVKPYLDSKKFRLIVDSRLEGEYSLKTAQKLSIIANKCLSKNPKARPKMSEVLEMVNQLVGNTSEGTT